MLGIPVRSMRRLLRRFKREKRWGTAFIQLLYASGVLLVLLLLAWLWSLLRPWRVALSNSDTTSAIEIVPAIVIAVLLFGVGITFVVAQVVPSARGTRAAALLTDVRVDLTIGPAIGLLIGVALLLIFHNVPHQGHWWWIDAPAMTLVLTFLTLVYVVVATVSLAAIYRDATNPEEFRVRVTSAVTATSREDGQDRVDEMYGAVRTLRGWARTAAMSGDSRELHEALSGFLQLCCHVADGLPADDRDELVPRAYSANRSLTNPMLGPSRVPAVPTPTDYVTWQEPRTWPRDSVKEIGFAADPLARAKAGVQPQAASRASNGSGVPLSESSVWFANEVARAIVRVVEIGFDNHSLLDRDLYRLLNSLGNAARIFLDSQKSPARDEARAGADQLADRDAAHENSSQLTRRRACAGVMIRSLAGAGLAAGSVIDKKPEWFYEPAAQLGCLWREFADDSGQQKDSLLVDGCAAGLVAVLCALEAAFPKHHLERSIEAVRSEIGGLPRIEDLERVCEIAQSGLFESPHHPRVIDVAESRYREAINVINKKQRRL
ncbi:hypothetical protein ACFQW6_07370 [Nocardioides sp. GCM10028917]|uniref:hypothetical protein n=1 Tax=Nocardioides sp. GCM10028917 TaxID=3273408 RepID=UPI00361A0E78